MLQAYRSWTRVDERSCRIAECTWFILLARMMLRKFFSSVLETLCSSSECTMAATNFTDRFFSPKRTVNNCRYLFRLVSEFVCTTVTSAVSSSNECSVIDRFHEKKRRKRKWQRAGQHAFQLGYESVVSWKITANFRIEVFQR